MHSRSSIRQNTVFPTRPTHLRVKTQASCIKQNPLCQNSSQIKKSLRTCRISEFENLSCSKNIPSTLSLKRYPPQRSIFGDLNFHAPKFKKHTISSPNLDHPLKDYISSLKPREIKRNFKKYKTFVNQGSQKFIHKTMATPHRFQTKIQEPNSVKTDLIDGLVDGIYKKIDKFKEVGYTEKKINEWIQKYCLQKRKYMTDLLMKASSKNKFSETYQNYFYERDPQKVKDKLRFVTKKVNGQEMPIDQFDLIEFSNYIEEILVQKNRLKINELRESISEKLDECFIYNRDSNQYQFGKKLYPADLLNFVSELQELEERQGKFEKISGFNRQYFNDLGKAEKQLRRKIYELIKITEKEKKEVIPEEETVQNKRFRLQKLPPSRPEQISKVKVFSICDIEQL